MKGHQSLYDVMPLGSACKMNLIATEGNIKCAQNLGGCTEELTVLPRQQQTVHIYTETRTVFISVLKLLFFAWEINNF